MSPAPRDSDWNAKVRSGETEAQRLDRNFSDLLQELRVSQTGVQILFAFLLTVPFSSNFRDVTPAQRAVYFATFVTSALSAAMIIAPAVMHRIVFRHHLKAELMRTAGIVAVSGQALLILAVAGAMWLIGDYLYGTGIGILVAVLALVWWSGWFFGVPLGMRAHHHRHHADAEPPSEHSPEHPDRYE